MPFRYEITSDQITCTMGLSVSRLDWNQILRVLRTGKGFLFYPRNKTFSWIPVSAFPDLTDIE